MRAMALLLTLQIVSASAAVPRVPAAIARQVNRSAMTVVQLLANSQVPTGFEVRASDSLLSSRISDFDTTGPFIAGDVFVQAFNAAHADYQGSIRDGVIVIRPVGRHLAYLDVQTTIGHLEVRGTNDRGQENI